MARLIWNAVNERFFEAGVDRAVLYPKNGSPVPWNGLISVEEGGADGVTSYYLDGRPYLHVPTPKEYTATLRAYTYPEAFGAAIGVLPIEDSDGLYVESQGSESFSFSYRTLIGNATEGLNHAYKIHLVYNAVVVPSAFGYETLSLDLNASEFTWNVSAVPIPIEGYRPSAHFIIDTRKMSEEILSKLEALLYGTATTEPSIPDPVDLIELLTYGGAIIIIDNGDGTWTAKGSRHDIYLLDVDTFQIDHVENTNYGDGTFGVTTTQT